MTVLWLFVVVSGFALCTGQSSECAPQDFGHGSVVCVCNATYCDTLGPVAAVPAGQYLAYTSTKDGKRFEREQRDFTDDGSETNITITIDHGQKYQSILGFGGAFTDAAGININSLGSASRQNLLRGYFSSDGIEYTLGRVPIGGTDFSTRPYTYDDDHDGDFNLTYFQLAPEDLSYKIPVIQEALAMSSRPIKLFASPWSAPEWMKTNEDLIGKGSLKGEPGGEYYQTWAEYYVRFLQEYGNNGLTFWGVTSQNEPVDGDIPGFTFNCMGYTSETLGIFIGENLGPTLAGSGYDDVQLMMFDDQRDIIRNWTNAILAEGSVATPYVDGIAYHWYTNFFTSPEILTEVHNSHPDTFILASEACTGVTKVLLGNWERGEEYAIDILEDLNHWVVGWTDWNLALDEQGGPNWANNFVDSPIIVDAANDQYYKQPMYYALGHYSKFLPPGSQIVASGSVDDHLDVLFVAAETPDQSTVLIVLNTSDEPTTVSIEDSVSGRFSAQIPANSFQTFVWWQQ